MLSPCTCQNGYYQEAVKWGSVKILPETPASSSRVPRSKFWLFCFCSGFLLNTLRGGWCFQYWAPATHVGELDWWLVSRLQPGPDDCCRHLGSELVDGRPLLSPSVSSLPSLRLSIQKRTMAKMQRKRNSWSLLEEIQIVIMENSTESSQRNPTFEYISKGTEVSVPKRHLLSNVHCRIIHIREIREQHQCSQKDWKRKHDRKD